jgi:transcriptional regulator with XRE-family HTH domain
VTDKGGVIVSDSFGTLLRHYRIAQHLTQEALAERAALSATAVAALERGRNRSPRFSTLRQLARALDLGPEQFEELARLAHEAGAAVTTEAHAAVGKGPPAEAATPDEVRRAAVEVIDPSSKAPARLPPIASRRWRADFVGRTRELKLVETAWRQ